MKNIHIVKDFIAESACEHVNDFLQLIFEGIYGGKFVLRNDLRRTELSVRDMRNNVREYQLLTAIHQRIYNEVVTNIDRTCEIYPEFMLLQSNRESDFHPRHADNRRYDNERSEWVPNHTPQRIVSSCLYLNECGQDYVGGEILFPDYGITITPKPGLLVAFQSDERCVHEVNPIVSGTRNAILMWFTGDKSLEERL